MNGGALEINSSLDIEQTCLPLILRLVTNVSICGPCKENSLIAQESQ